MGFPIRSAPFAVYMSKTVWDVFVLLGYPRLYFDWPGEVVDVMYTLVTTELEGSFWICTRFV